MGCFLFYGSLNNSVTNKHTLFVSQQNRKYDVYARGYFNILFLNYVN